MGSAHLQPSKPAMENAVNRFYIKRLSNDSFEISVNDEPEEPTSLQILSDQIGDKRPEEMTRSELVTLCNALIK